MDPTRSIPFFDYPAFGRRHFSEISAAIEDVIRRGAFILQKDLQEFEREAAEFLGVPHFLGVADGTNAIILALRAAGIGPGDEVIVPSHTFIATASAVHFVGAKLVLVDCGPDHLVDAKSIEGALTSRTKCIIPVHLNGRVAQMNEIESVATKHGLVVVEDAAQAFGARYREKVAGSFGIAGTFSFYPAKSLGCFGDGGAIICSDSEIYERLFAMRDHGRNSQGEISRWGTNCRLDNIQAAILRVKLRHLAEDIRIRRELARRYIGHLSALNEVVLPPFDGEPGRFDTFQNFEIECEERDRLREHLHARGIGTILPWGGKALHQLPPIEVADQLLATERLFSRCMLLPMNQMLSLEDVDRVSSEIERFYRG